MTGEQKWERLTPSSPICKRNMNGGDGAFLTIAVAFNERPLWVEAVGKRVCRGRQADLNSQVVAESARLSRHSGPDCLQQRSDTDEIAITRFML